MMLDKNVLGGFYGTEQYHRWSPVFPKVVLTDGAKYVADHGGQSGAHWLMDAIASQILAARDANEMCEHTQFWELVVHDDRSAVLTCVPDSGMEPVVTQKIRHTDFDVSPFSLWVQPTDLGDRRVWVIFLPSEY